MEVLMSVFLRKQNLKKGVYLSFIEAFYNSDSKNTTQKTIRKIGYVDDLKKTYTDPIAYFTEEAKKLSLESSKPLKHDRRFLIHHVPEQARLVRMPRMRRLSLLSSSNRRLHISEPLQ